MIVERPLVIVERPLVIVERPLVIVERLLISVERLVIFMMRPLVVLDDAVAITVGGDSYSELLSRWMFFLCSIFVPYDSRTATDLVFFLHV